MTVHQMLVHIGDAGRGGTWPAPVFGDPTSRTRGLVRFIALYLLPRTPRGIKSGAEPAAKVLDAAAFAQDRDRAIALLVNWEHRTEAGRRPSGFWSHGLGRLDALRYLHTDHHLRQFGL
jgi:hypothetical protein